MAAPARDALNRMSSAGPNIGYDARMSLGQYRGMGRYLRALIAGRELRLLGLCAAGEGESGLSYAAAGMGAWPLWEQISLPGMVRKHSIDVLIAPYNTAPLRLPDGTRLVLVVHDLIFLDPMPLSGSMYQNAGRVYRKWVTPRAAARADLIVTVSRYTAHQLVTRLGVDERRLRVIPLTLDERWYDEPGPNDSKGARTPGLVLAVSGEAPSKNLHRALQAFALVCKRIPSGSVHMKIAGVKQKFHATFMKQARELGIADAVEFLSFQSDAAMRALYREAELLLMPSLAEGFGIPVLEAMASGLPVAASDAASLPEVGGDAPLYFDPTVIEPMAATLHRILSDCAMRAQMSARGRIQARRFHPDAVRWKIQSLWEEIEQGLSRRGQWSSPDDDKAPACADAAISVPRDRRGPHPHPAHVPGAERALPADAAEPVRDAHGDGI